ncbi:MAG: hypothetical protein AABN33_24845 [Acidobacteriota bacterium]
MQVDYRKYHDVSLLNAVEDPVREPVRLSPPSFAVDRLVLKGILDNPTQHSVNFRDKIAPQPVQLLLVPTRGTPQVGLGLPSD